MTSTGQTYQVIRPIAEGGMGSVELAVRKEGEFRRVFALKRLKGDLENDAAAQAMFVEEGRVAGLLRHPNVVSVIDVGRDERGAYLVMDFVEGMSASQILSAAVKAGRSLPVQVVVRILLDVARGLDAAHELRSHDGKPLGLVHRDVSPQNIMVGFDGVARLTDFGIAKAFGRINETTTGLLKGKAGYMSPEQFRFQEPDPRSDLFSLGVVLFEMLTGRRMYKRPSVALTARAVLEDAPPDVEDSRSDAPPGLIELYYQLVAKDAEHRPTGARELGRALGEVLTDLVAAEGVIEVRDYLESAHAERRDELRAELAGIWDGVESIPPLAMQTPRPKRWPWLAGLAAASALAASVWAWPAETEAPETPDLVTAPPQPAEEAPEETPPAVAPVVIPSAVNSPPAVNPSADPDVAAQAQMEEAPTPMRRRRVVTPPADPPAMDPRARMIMEWE